MPRSLPLALLAPVVVLACLLSGCGETTPTQQPDFAFAVAPTASKPQPGTTDTEILSFSVVNNYFQDFSGMPYTVTDSVAGLIFTGTVASFGPGAVVPLTVTIPPPAAPGPHTYTVMLDPQNQVAESDELNNVATVNLVYANGDLFFSSTSATVTPANPTDADANLQLTFGVTYSASSLSAGTISNLPFTVAKDGVVIFTGTLPALTPNSQTFVPVILPPDSAGTYIYTVTIDPGSPANPGGLLPETDETNNSQNTTVTVLPSGIT